MSWPIIFSLQPVNKSFKTHHFVFTPSFHFLCISNTQTKNT